MIWTSADMLIVSGNTFLTFLIMNFNVTLLNEFSQYLQIIFPLILGILFYLTLNYLLKIKGLMYALELIKNYTK
jgi:hypothetical protein